MTSFIEFKNVSKELDNKKVLENVSFSVEKNDLFGYLGPNGAGKTTSIRILLGLLKPTRGEVLVKGNPIKNGKGLNEIGFVLENDGLYANLTAYDNLEFFARVFLQGNKNDGLKKQMKQVLELVGLSDAGEVKVGKFSKGMKKRLALARALIHRPKLLILDEPLSGLDPEVRIKIRKLLKNLTKDMTIFMSSHDLTEVQLIATRVAILNRKVLVCDTMQSLKDREGKVIQVQVENFDSALLPYIKQIPGVKNVELKRKFIKILKRKTVNTHDILKFFFENDITICEIKEMENQLEDIYLKIIGGDLID